MHSIEGGFPRKHRLLKPDEFRRVFNGNVRSIDHNFVVLARCNGLSFARLGLAISKRKLRRAVDRNHVKRLIRESFRRHQVLLRGLDLVVINRSVDMFESNEHYLESLLAHWQRLAKKCNQS